MEKIIKKYSKLLDNSSKHLSYETIAAYINLYSELSSKEKIFVKDHLNTCKDCFKKFTEVFDEDFEFDERTIAINFYQINIDNTKRAYQNDKGDIEISFSVRDSKNHLEFNRLPDEYKNQNFRIDLGTAVFRILSAEENKSYFLNQFVNLEDISEIKVSFLKIYDKEETNPGFKSNKYFVYGSAAAILIVMFIIGYFYFTPHSKKIIAVNENKTAVDSSFNKDKSKKEQNNKNETQTTNDNLIAENKINEKDFKENAVLENFTNRNVRSEQKVKIISPGISDTLIKKIQLKWSSTVKGASYKITIVNNRNEKAWESTTFGKDILVNKKLPPGLYYWKILINKKLEAVGKFFVK